MKFLLFLINLFILYWLIRFLLRIFLFLWHFISVSRHHRQTMGEQHHPQAKKKHTPSGEVIDAEFEEIE